MKTLNGNHVRKMFMHGYALLDKNKEAVDALNVFPVPDGDTGINMALTLKSVIKELDLMSSNDLTAVCECASRGALKGARGNSGVILSQILKGMMAELATFKGANAEAGVKAFVSAMEKGTATAYKAVSIPKEGTILTVIREMSEEGKKIAKTNMEIEDFMTKVIKAGEDSLARTPDLLPVLKKAGVVDAGGRGLMVMFAGFLSGLTGDESIEIDFEKDRVSDGESGASFDFEALEEIEFAYCTEFNITNMYKTTTMAVMDSLREKYMRISDPQCVLVVGDLSNIKVHVHTNVLGEVLTLALNLGEITNLKVDNMLEQNRELRAKNQVQEKEQGMIAVASGEGLISLFKDLGCDAVIKGGQTMNPSAEDIAEACRRTHAKNIFLFPNNKNIILAAKHAGALVDKNIIVIPTKSINEGISACIVFNSETTIEENTEQFLSAIECVKSGAVTYAVKNTKMDRFDIAQGEIIGLNDKNILAKGKTPNEVAMKLVDKMMDDNIVHITLFFGADMNEKDAHALQDKLIKKYPNCEVSTIMGGQPVYYYLISLE